MNFRKFTTSFWLAGSAVVLAAISVPAEAAPFSSALVAAFEQNITTGNGNCASGQFDCFSTNTSGAATSTQSYSQSFPGVAFSSYAQANLSTATLKAKAAANVGNPSFNPYVQSNATFSDGFTTTTTGGQPFVWNGAQATFNLNFTGNNVLNSNGNNNNASAFVILAINARGSTDPTTNWFTGPSTMNYFLYQFGPNTPSIYYTYNGHGTQLTTTQSFASVPASIGATFAPGGDFDWVLLFGVSGQEYGVGSFNYDLSHTLTLDYQGPAGTVTTSDSGVFGTQVEEIPEPLTLSLFAAGLAGAAGLRSRRKKKA